MGNDNVTWGDVENAVDCFLIVRTMIRRKGGAMQRKVLKKLRKRKGGVGGFQSKGDCGN